MEKKEISASIIYPTFFDVISLVFFMLLEGIILWQVSVYQINFYGILLGPSTLSYILSILNFLLMMLQCIYYITLFIMKILDKLNKSNISIFKFINYIMLGFYGLISTFGMVFCLIKSTQNPISKAEARVVISIQFSDLLSFGIGGLLIIWFLSYIKITPNFNEIKTQEEEIINSQNSNQMKYIPYTQISNFNIQG